MKLFVVGPPSADPAEWVKDRDGFGLVIAADEDAARAMTGKAGDCPVQEVPMDTPMVLALMFDDPMFYQ